MKRLLCLLLITVMMLGLCACNKTSTAESTAVTTVAPTQGSVPVSVGYGRVDITPKMSVPLAGYGMTEKRMSIVAKDPLYATCVAITDENEETVLLLSQDLINSTWYKEAQEAISAATAVPAANIIIAATHTHSAPDQASSLESIAAYKLDYLDGVAAAAVAAMEDRSEVVVTTGRTHLERMNGVRHYLMADGTYAGDNFGSFEDNAVVEPAEEKDDELQVIRFAREDKQDIVMVNWQAHPAKNGAGNSYIISADFVADVRNNVERTTGEHFIYFTGAAGNLNPSSKLDSECVPLDSFFYGQRLAEAVVKLLEDMETPVITGVKTTQKTYTGQILHELEDKLEQAQEVQRVWDEKGVSAANELAEKYGFITRHHASAIIRRVDYPQTKDMEVTAITLGDISFVTAPYEMFAAHGMYIKENSPAEMTFVISCCNGSFGYLPTNKAFDYHCYEAYSGNFARGTGDEVARLLVDMLQQLQ